MKLSTVYEFEPRKRKKCSFCDKVRLTARAMWQVEMQGLFGPEDVTTHHIEVHVCNDCLARRT